MNEQSQDKVVNCIAKMLSEFFVITNDPYLGATEYNKKKSELKSLSPNKRVKRVHELVTNEARQRFKLYPKKIADSRMEIDLWNQADKTAYEIHLGVKVSYFLQKIQ